MVQGNGTKVSFKWVLENRQVGACVKGGKVVLDNIGVFRFVLADVQGGRVVLG